MIAGLVAAARARAQSGDGAGAEAALREAVGLAPDDPQPLQLLADLLLSRPDTAGALPLYERLLALPGQRSALNLLHLGFCQEHEGRLAAAAATYRAALALDPGLLEPHVNLAGMLWRLADFSGALAHAQAAVAIAPSHPYAQRILGAALLNLNRAEEAEKRLRAALQLQPEFPAAQLDLAMAVMLAGRLPEGWTLYERRWNDPRSRRPPFFDPPREWPGPQVPLAGTAIAVYGEQGHGDVLQMLRFLPRVQALAGGVVCVLPRGLEQLVEASFPGVHCVRPGENLQVQWHAALMDLPGRFGVTLADLPAAPYLRAPDSASERWRARLQPWTGRPRIGIAWSGSLVQANNGNRAFPLSLLRPLLEDPRVQCFSLQKDDAGAWSDWQPPPQQLVDLTGDWADFGDSAAMIAQLDLVITVDSAVAHLAGALGQPTWVLLPPNADWRWLRERQDSPWYPQARLFRRGHDEHRSAQAARLLAAFQAWLASR